MCLLAVLYRLVPGYPVVLAANRDEYHDRQGEPPQVWSGMTSFCAPKDPRGGGTWLGCNSYETIVALTNRDSARFDKRRRSRGLLCTELLQAAFPSDAAKILQRELALRRYNGFNLFCAGPGHAFVVRYEGRPVFQDLGPGIHVLSNGDLNDESAWKVARTASLLEKLDYRDIRSLITDLKIICADHVAADPADPAAATVAAARYRLEPICVHDATRGTLSSTIIAIGDDASKSICLHAQGSPCTTRYEDYSRMLRSVLVRARWRE